MKAIRFFALMAMISLMAVACGGGVKFDEKKFKEYYEENRVKKTFTQEEYSTMMEYVKTTLKEMNKYLDEIKQYKENSDKDEEKGKEILGRMIGMGFFVNDFGSKLEYAYTKDLLDSSNKKKYESLIKEIYKMEEKAKELDEQ